MSVYSNTEMRQAIKDNHIVFHPFNDAHINGSSIDVTLGEWYFRTDRANRKLIYNPFDEDHVRWYFSKPQKAVPHAQWCQETGTKLLTNIPADHPIIMLEPGERILAHSHEFIGIKAPGTSSMQSRSTWGRNGLAVCFDAGWGDPGYINRWTMEIYNLNQHHRIVLPVGERIAQIVFYKTGHVDGEYQGLSGKYQLDPQADLAELIKHWKPEDMLPKAYKDSRALPSTIALPAQAEHRQKYSWQ